MGEDVPNLIKFGLDDGSWMTSPLLDLGANCKTLRSGEEVPSFTKFGLEHSSIDGSSSTLEVRACRRKMGLEEPLCSTSSDSTADSPSSEDGAPNGTASNRYLGALGLDVAPSTWTFGLELGSTKPERRAKEDFEPIWRKVDIFSGSDGSRARSSDARLLSCSHAKRPERPSLELKLLSREFALPGRLRSPPEIAEDGRESSDCASYMSLSVFTDFFNRTGGPLGVVGATCGSDEFEKAYSGKRPAAKLRALFCFRIVLGRSTC